MAENLGLCRMSGSAEKGWRKMKQILSKLGLLLIVPGTITLPSAALAQDSFADAFWQYRASTGIDVSSGYYGARERTTIVYVPATLQAAKGPWTARAVFSYLEVSGPALLIDGSSAGESLGVRTSGKADGPGDINLYASYSFESLYDRGLFIDLTGRVKAPTASFNKGLGTGAWDFAVQLDAAQAIGDFVPFATLGYKFSGDPTGFALRNVVYGSAGAQYSLNDTITFGAYYDIRQSAIRGAATPQEGTGYVNVRLSDDWSLLAYGVKGFSDNSPTVGGGLSITYRWR